MRAVLVVVLVFRVESGIAFGSTFQRMVCIFLSRIRTHALSVRAALFRLHALMFKAVVPTHGVSFHGNENTG